MESTINNVKPTTKRRNQHPDRITVNDASLAKLDQWTKTVREELKGSRFTRNDMINWLIEKADSELSTSDLKQIRDKFFDPHRALEWALQQMKEAQKSGQVIDAEQFVQEILKPKRNIDSKKIRKKKLKIESTAKNDSAQATTEVKPSSD